MARLFLDSYALFELADGNARYAQTVRQNELATTQMNLLELYFGLLRRATFKEAEYFFEKFRPFVVDPSDVAIKKAARFKLAHPESRFSFVDCLGYAMAMELGAGFLTGDAEFERFPNVTFVK